MIGKTIANGKIRIDERIGEGAFAVVYGGVHMSLDLQVAIKILKEEYYHDREITGRFNTEARAIARLSHPNVVHIIDCGFEDGCHYYVMSRLNQSLSQLIQEKGKLSVAEVIRISIDTAHALTLFYERSITHRDIKPDNILFNESGEAVLTDFGIATGKTLKKITQPGTILGTPQYMAPEQIKGEDVDHRTDLYAFGIVMYEMITGEVPFDGVFTRIAQGHVNEVPLSPIEKSPNIPERLCNIIMKLIEKDRKDRYQNAAELLSDLEELKQFQLTYHLKSAEHAKSQNKIALEILEYEEYLKLSPRDSEIRRRFEKSQKIARRDSHIRRANAAQEARQYHNAFAELQDALLLDPENEELKRRIGEVQNRINRDDLIHKSKLSEEKGILAEAIKALEQALAYDSSDESLSARLTELKKRQTINEHQRNMENARKEKNAVLERECAQHILLMTPENIELRQRVAALDAQIAFDRHVIEAKEAEEENQLDVALQALTKANRLFPQMAEIVHEMQRIENVIEVQKHIATADAYVRENNVRQAILQLDEAACIDPHNKHIQEKREHLQNAMRRDTHVRKGKEAEAAGRTEKAIDEYESALKLDPNNGALKSLVSDLKKARDVNEFTGLAERHFAAGDYGSALEMYVRVGKLAPSEEIERIIEDLKIKKKVADYVRSAEAHLKDGELEQALIDYDKAYCFNPTEELGSKIQSVKAQVEQVDYYEYEVKTTVKKVGEPDKRIVEKGTIKRTEPSKTLIGTPSTTQKDAVDAAIEKHPGFFQNVKKRMLMAAGGIIIIISAALVITHLAGKGPSLPQVTQDETLESTRAEELTAFEKKQAIDTDERVAPRQKASNWRQFLEAFPSSQKADFAKERMTYWDGILNEEAIAFKTVQEIDQNPHVLSSEKISAWQEFRRRYAFSENHEYAAERITHWNAEASEVEPQVTSQQREEDALQAARRIDGDSRSSSEDKITAWQKVIAGSPPSTSRSEAERRIQYWSDEVAFEKMKIIDAKDALSRDEKIAAWEEFKRQHPQSERATIAEAKIQYWRELFIEEFSDRNSNWPESNTPDVIQHISNGEYIIFARSTSRLVPYGGAQSFDDFQLETSVKYGSGDSTQFYGIAFRIQDSGNFYMFGLSGDGKFCFRKKVNYELSRISCGESQAIRREENADNRIKITARGTTFEFYVNGNLIAGPRDNAVSSGKVGFYVDPGVMVHFDFLHIQPLTN